MHSRFAAGLLLSCAVIRLAAAQTPSGATHLTEPVRPHLLPGADTNSASAYYQLGLERLNRDPEVAAAAFYWASRIEPTYAPALYARHVAMLLSDPPMLEGWEENNPRTLRRPEIKTIDSLELRARILDPFVHPALDQMLIQRYIDWKIRESNGTPQSQGELDYEIRTWLNQVDDPGWRGFMTLTQGDFRASARWFNEQARRYPRSWRPHFYRAQALVLGGSADSAATEMRSAIRLAATRDTTAMWLVYESKEALQFSLGTILEQARDTAGARAAYEQALVENLGFWAAHIRLGQLAAAAHDTARALRELQAAVDTREDDYFARLSLSWMQAASNHLADAIPNLERASQLEPYAAEPWDLLGQIHDVLRHYPQALTAYNRFLALARQNDPERAIVTRRVAQLRATAPAQ